MDDRYLNRHHETDRAVIQEIASNAARQVVEDTVRAALREAVELATKAAMERSHSGEALSRDLIIKTVQHTLTQLGVDSEDPLEMQKDFQHLREWRRAGEEIKSKAGLALITTLMGGIISLIVLGFKQWS